MVSRHITNIISSIFGKFAEKEFAKPIQNFINSAYVKLMGLDMSRFEEPSNYKSLKELFIRPLKEDVPIDSHPKSVISPCDAKVIELGKIKTDTALQIKGMSYCVSNLIDRDSHGLEGGSYINFYLSPKDYHRYHMPFDVKVLSLKYIPGKLYPVNRPYLKRKEGLYIENERVVIKVLDNFNNRHYIVLVGALNVGKMVVTFEPKVKTNAQNGKAHYIYERPIKLKKGELFGWFELGSTIVMLSEKNALKYIVNLDDDVEFGEIIGELNDN